MDDGLPIAFCASASTVAASFAPEQPAAHSTTLATTRRIFVMVEAPGCDDLYFDWDYGSSRRARLRSELRATVILHLSGTTGSRNRRPLCRRDPHAMMRAVRGTIATVFAATLLALAIGLQVLEATGRWDRTLQDTGDEAIIVTVVLCVGAALVAARVTRPRLSLSAIQAVVVILIAVPLASFVAPAAWSSFDTSPPLSLRI